MERKSAANKVLPKAGVNGFDLTFVQGSTLGILLNFCAKNPRLRQYPNRWRQLKEKRGTRRKTWIIKALPAFGISNKKLSKTSFDIFQFSSIKTIGGDLKTTNKKQA